MAILFLDSKKASNNKFKLDESISGIYKLLSFTFTNNIFNINDTNNKVYWNENSIDKISTLTNGFYEATDLNSHISTILNQDGSGTITSSFNDINSKFTITNTLNMYFTFGSNTTNSASKLLGFNDTDGSASTSITSDNCIDLNTYKNIWIDLTQNNNRNINGIDYFNTSLFITGLGNYGEIMRYIKNDYFDQYIKLQNTKLLELSFHDNNHKDIELNSDYEIILQKC